jgi:hypothetical protein
MGTLYLKMAVNPSYSTSDFATELVLGRVKQDDDKDVQTRIDLTLEGLAGPLSRLMLGAAMVAQDTLTKAGFPDGVVPLCEHEEGLPELSEQKYCFTLEITEQLLANQYKTNAQWRTISKLSITLIVEVQIKPNIADFAAALEFLEKSVAAMCRNLLIANRVVEVVAEPITGIDAAELAQAMQTADNAWSVARQIKDAIESKLSADNATLEAREQLAKIMADTAAGGAE